MLLSNFAPQFGIFNGAICSFKGLLYLPNDVNVKLKTQDLKKLKVKSLVLQQPFDLRGGNNLSRYLREQYLLVLTISQFLVTMI